MRLRRPVRLVNTLFKQTKSHKIYVCYGFVAVLYPAQADNKLRNMLLLALNGNVSK